MMSAVEPGAPPIVIFEGGFRFLKWREVMRRVGIQARDSPHCPPLRTRMGHPALVTWPYWNRRLLVQEALSKTQFIRDRVDGFGHDPIGFQLERQLSIPGFRVSLWVIKRKVENQCLRVDSPDALYHVEIFGMRVADGIEPRGIFETHRIHHQCVAFPLANGFPKPGEVRNFGMRPVEGNLPPGFVVFPELINGVWGLHNFESHRMNRSARITVRSRVSPCRLRSLFQACIRAVDRPLALHPLQCPGRVRYITLGAGLLGHWIGRTQGLDCYALPNAG